jgi:hypothetical protein
MISLLFSLFLVRPAQAYIPEYSLIASQAADQHGSHGAFEISQLVVFRKDGESYSVHEDWIVEDENRMLVTFEGRGPLKGLVQGRILYLGTQKYFYNNGVMRQRLGEEWLKPFLHFRSSKYLRSRLVALNIAPPESLHNRPPLDTKSKIKYQAPGFIRLSRVGGTICYAVGRPPVNGETPTAWIEQDQFVLRKLKTAHGVTFKASDYSENKPGLWYPSQMSYAFGGFTVEIQTLQVKYLGRIKSNDPRFKLASLKKEEPLKLPDLDGLRDFYQRFR